MFERMSWSSAYELWKHSRYFFPKSLFEAPAAESVFVDYNQENYIYGYDWLSNEEMEERKRLIKDNPSQFLCFTQPTNKGTIQTAQMLTEAKDEEELAAIWIAATSFELKESDPRNGVRRYAYALHDAAISFLRERFYVWHHAMRRLVPDIMIPNTVLESLRCDEAEPVIGLIQMNAMMLKGSYTLLRYSSLSDEELAKEQPHSLRLAL